MTAIRICIGRLGTTACFKHAVQLIAVLKQAEVALSIPEGWDMDSCILLLVAVSQHVLGRRTEEKHSNIGVDLVGHADICPVLQLLGKYRKECRVRQSHASSSVRSRNGILPCVRMRVLGNVSTDE